MRATDRPSSRKPARAQDFLTRTIKKVLDEETMRLENGLTVLATVGATAPFVGLFGTVWGVYHALVAIGLSGSGSLDKVAGPVGEALIMTGLGLAVAMPAVMGYNWLTRSNRVLTAKLDAFAFELFAFLSSGQTLRTGNQSPADNLRNLSVAGGAEHRSNEIADPPWPSQASTPNAPARRWRRSTWCR